MGNASDCCVRRDDPDGLGDRPSATRCESWHSLPEIDERWTFFDDQEGPEAGDTDGGASSSSKEAPTVTVPDAALLRQGKSSRRAPLEKRGTWIPLKDESSVFGRRRSSFCKEKRSGNSVSGIPSEDERANVAKLQEEVRRIWSDRQKHLDANLKALLSDGFFELDEWTDERTCSRMLGAVQGDEPTATQMLVKAIECRVLYRELFETLHCQVFCDIRIIGRDSEHRPVVYMCARNQNRPVKDIIPQLLVAFEAAVEISESDGGTGHIAFIADMHHFAPGMNMDVAAIKELGGVAGTVFADRFAWILFVDFSWLAQGMWSLCKPLMSERTQKKINFVSVAKAEQLAKETLAPATRQRVLSSFDINRDARTSDAEREVHARRTSICDVPIGIPRIADVAG